MSDQSNNILDKLKSSTVFKVISGYAVVAFITVQVASLLDLAKHLCKMLSLVFL